MMSKQKADSRSLAQEALRRRAVAAVKGGMQVTQAAKVFDVSRTAIYKWLKAAARGGSRALRSKKRGRPPRSRLKPWQAASITRLITDRCPDQLKIPFVLWTREAVAELIATRRRVSVSVCTVGRYLKRWGFTPQKPLRRAYEKNPKAVKKWLDRQYPAIRARAKRAGAEIHWGDEMGLRSDHQTGACYGRKGRTPVVMGTGRRFSCNMISTVTNRGTLRFMIFSGRFTGDVFIGFLKRLIRSASGKVYLIVDGHPVHRSAKVRRWIEANAQDIQLFILPPYSPELNPDELLNNDVKSNALGRRRPRDRDEMISMARAYLYSTQKRPDIVRNYFSAESVRYAA